MQKIKNYINRLYRLMGYTIAKFDESEYTFREILENFIKSKNLSGKSLDIGGGQWTFPQKEYAAISFDKIKWPNVDVVGDVCQLDKYFSNTKFDVIFFIFAASPLLNLCCNNSISDIFLKFLN